jgi:hypothetical protein
MAELTLQTLEGEHFSQTPTLLLHHSRKAGTPASKGPLWPPMVLTHKIKASQLDDSRRGATTGTGQLGCSADVTFTRCLYFEIRSRDWACAAPLERARSGNASAIYPLVLLNLRCELGNIAFMSKMNSSVPDILLG